MKNYTDHLLLDCVVHRDVPVRHFDDPAGARSNATRRCLWHHLLSNAGFLQVTLVSGYCITSIGTRLRTVFLRRLFDNQPSSTFSEKNAD